MKILYIAHERRSAELAATALRNIAPELAVAWAGHLSVAMRWVHDNRDLAALVVEAEVQNQNCTSLVSQVRSLGLTAPVIVVASEETGAPLAALKAGADDYVANRSLLADLPDIVNRAVQRTQATTQPARRPLRLLYIGDAALARECLNPRCSIEITEAVTGSNSTAEFPLPFDILLVEHDHPGVNAFAILKGIAARRLHVPAIFVVGRDEELAVPALKLGAMDYVVKTRDSFRALFFRLERGLAHSARLKGLADPVFDAVTERQDRERQPGGRESEAPCLAEAARTDSQALETQLLSARVHSDRVQREHAARQDWEKAREHLQAAAANGERLERQVHNALAGASDQERANRDTLAQHLAAAQAALEDAERWHASEMATAAAQLAERQGQHDAGLAQTAADRDRLTQQLREAEAALEGAQQAAASVAAAAAERLTRREGELAATLAEATATRHALELRLADAATALQQAEERASVEQLAAAQASQRREEEVEVRLAQEVANRDTLAQHLAAAQAAFEDAERWHASEMATAAAQLAEREAQHDAGLAQTAADRDRLTQQLREADVALEGAQQAAASVAAAAAERLTRREGELAATLAEATATRHALELRLADAATALQQAEERASVEQLAAAQASQRREEEVEVRLAQEVANRKNVERDLADTRLASEQSRRCFLDEVAAVVQRTREHEALLEERSAQERFDHEGMRAEMQEEIRHLRLECDTRQQSLDTSQEQLQRVKGASDEARENLEHARMITEAELQRLAAEYAEAQQRLEQVRADFEHTLERASSEHAAERAGLETLVTERDTQLKEQAAAHAASQQAAKNALTQVEDGLRLALEARSRDRHEIEQLQEALEARGQELEATRRDREILRTEADRVPQLQNQLDDSRAENRRQFEHTPYGFCGCTRDGALKHVNHALVALLGYRTSDELRTADFATTVFESADDLRLLIERCLSRGTPESVETTWRRKDSGRLVVRLLALPAASESIEIVVEDITSLRATEERLRQAQRMEAVGRLASEVAETCDNLLRDVSQNAQQWLTTIDRGGAFRHQGELLLHEVMRAAGFLRQLSVYGKKQASALEPIDVNRVLRDLEPVLKRIAGDDIELVLPKTSSPVNVDVEAERVERVLVNVASYGRERMPFGGRLTIELATVVVGREFVAKYPNVRPGDHVLITVTDVKGGLRSDVPIGLRKEPAGANTMTTVSDRPGVDLGVLQGLIRDCGGHLWMKAEPTGDMVLKVRLPQRVLDGPAEPSTGVPRSDRGRSMVQRFGH